MNAEARLKELDGICQAQENFGVPNSRWHIERQWVRRVVELENAIKKHRALYAVLGDGDNCARFIERRCEGGHWPSYTELEAKITIKECCEIALQGVLS